MDTWHPDTRPVALDFDPDTEWLGLEIVDKVAGLELDSEGVVEFKARFRRGSEHFELHERSSFMRVDGNWRYLTGT